MGDRGLFYLEELGHNDALRSWYGLGQYGPDSGLTWELLCQGTWLAVLVGCAWPRGSRSRPLESPMQLALLMLVVFLLVFECRARHLYLFSPYFVLLGVRGWSLMASDVMRGLRAVRGRIGGFKGTGSRRPASMKPLEAAKILLSSSKTNSDWQPNRAHCLTNRYSFRQFAAYL